MESNDDNFIYGVKKHMLKYLKRKDFLKIKYKYLGF